jgi:hypothetical protein
MYSRIEFTQRNITINQGETKHVEVKVPTGVIVLYEAAKQAGVKIVEVYGAGKYCVVYGEKPGVSIISASNAQGTMSDEMIVEVKKVDDAKIRYITTPETIFSMTDMQHPDNKVDIPARTFGTKDDGTTFTETDDQRLQWRLVSGEGVITVNGQSLKAGNENSYVTASKPQIRPVKIGSAELGIRHPEIAGYSRSVYFNITANLDNFDVQPRYVSLTAGEKLNVAVQVTIENAGKEGEAYGNVTYKRDAEGINNITVIKDDKTKGLYNISIMGDAKKYSGVVAFTYGGTTINVNVEIGPKKLFNVSPVQIPATPGAWFDNVILTIEPEIPKGDPDGRIKPVRLSTSDNIDNGVKPNPVIYYDETPGVAANQRWRLKFKTSENEGLFNIYLNAWDIERTISVQNTWSKTFHPKDYKEIRGKPGDKLTKAGGSQFPFVIDPGVSSVVFSANGNPDGITSTPVVDSSKGSVDPNNRYFEVELLKSGYTELEFISPDLNNAVMKVPVYAGYDYIVPSWKLEPTSGSKTMYSRLDASTSIIFIAAGETVNLVPNIDTVKYRNNDFSFPSSDGKKPKTSIVRPSANDPNSAYFGDFLIRRTGAQIIEITLYPGTLGETASTTGFDYLSYVSYLGDVTVNYQYSDKSKDKPNDSFYQKFIVYGEYWKRKP